MRNENLKPRRALSDSLRITSRYADFEGIRIDPVKVPELFRHLIPFAKNWAIGDDVERIEFMKRTPDEYLRLLVEVVGPFDCAIWNWCSSLHNDIPVADEVVIFDGLLQAVSEAKIMLQ